MSEEKIDTLEAQNKQLKLFLKKTNDKRKDLENELKKLNESVEAKDMKLQFLETMINESTAESEALKNKLNDANIKIETLQIEINQLKETINSSDNSDADEKTQSSDDTMNLKQKLKKSKAQIIDLNDEIMILKAKISELQKGKETNISNSKPSSDDISALKKKYDDVISQLEQNKRAGCKLKAFLKNLQHENERLKEERDQLTKQLETVSSRLTEQSAATEQNGNEIRELRQKLREAQEAANLIHEDGVLWEAEKQRLLVKLRDAETLRDEAKAASSGLKRLADNADAENKRLLRREKELLEQLETATHESEQLERALSEANAAAGQRAEEVAASAEMRERLIRESCEARAAREEAEVALAALSKKRASILLCPSSPIAQCVLEEGGVEEVTGAYLQRLLVEFFAQDRNARESLIGPMLAVAGCTERQCEEAINSWRKSQKRRGWFS